MSSVTVEITQVEIVTVYANKESKTYRADEFARFGPNAEPICERSYEKTPVVEFKPQIGYCPIHKTQYISDNCVICTKPWEKK